MRPRRRGGTRATALGSTGLTLGSRQVSKVIWGLRMLDVQPGGFRSPAALQSNSKLLNGRKITNASPAPTKRIGKTGFPRPPPGRTRPRGGWPSSLVSTTPVRPRRSRRPSPGATAILPLAGIKHQQRFHRAEGASQSTCAATWPVLPSSLCLSCSRPAVSTSTPVRCLLAWAAPIASNTTVRRDRVGGWVGDHRHRRALLPRP